MTNAHQKYPNRLRRTIKQSGFTIEQIAEETEIPLRTLFDYCAGRVPIPRNRLEVLASALGYPTEYLVPTYPDRDTIEQPIRDLLVWVDSEISVASKQAKDITDQLRPVSRSIIAEEQELGANLDMDTLRRQLLKQLLEAGGLVILSPAEIERVDAQPRYPISISIEEFLSHCEASVQTCWQLYYNGGSLPELHKKTTTYITQLDPLVNTSVHQATAASLASQTYQLASMVSLENEDYSAALSQANHAVEYAQLTHDPNMEVAALMRKVTVLFYHKRYRQASSVLQLTLQHIHHVSPLMQARIYSELAADTASNEQMQDIVRHIKMGVDTCPQDAAKDPAFNYTHTSPYLIHFNEGIAYTNLSLYKDAWRALEQAEKYVLNASSTRRMELLTYQVSVATNLGDLDLSSEKMKETIVLGKVLNSNLWFSDIETIYEKLQCKWRGEPTIEDLGEMIKYEGYYKDADKK